MSLKELIRSDISEVFLNTDDFASECLYETKAVSLIVNQHILPRSRRGDVLDNANITARGADFIGAMADLLNGDPDYVPRAGEEITWKSHDNQPRKFVVFPRIGGQCFDYADPERVAVRIYGIDADDLRRVKIVGVAENLLALAESIRPESVVYDFGSETKVEATAIYLLRSDLDAKGITSFPVTLKIEIEGDERQWTTRASDSEWGDALVKIGLERENLIRKWQAQNNAAV